jgi:hypothetical protein
MRERLTPADPSELREILHRVVLGGRFLAAITLVLHDLSSAIGIPFCVTCRRQKYPAQANCSARMRSIEEGERFSGSRNWRPHMGPDFDQDFDEAL